MRIVELASSWPAEIFIQRHLDALTQAGVDVRCAAKRPAGSLTEKATIQPAQANGNVKLLPDFDRMPASQKITAILGAMSRKAFYRPGEKLRRRVWLAEISKLRPDLIHFHNAQLAAHQGWIPKSLGIPYTVSVRGADVQEIPLQDPLLAGEIRNVLAGASGIHAVCRVFGEYPLLSGLEVTTIYTTIPVLKEIPVYPEFDGNYRLVSVGRLHWRKGYPDLLMALRGLLEVGVQAELTIYGSGPDRERLEFWIERLGLSSQVVLAGKTDPAVIQKAVLNAHAYVQSSYAEGLSNALAEAMAWGCPVFATDIAGTSEIITEGENGMLLPVGEPDKWVESLLSIRDRQLMIRMREAAFRKAKSLFAADKHAEAFRALYEKAAGIKRGEGFRVASKYQLRKAQNRHFRALRVLISGEWRWQSGIDLLLKEFKRAGLLDKIELRVVGQGPQEDELRYLAELLGLEQGIFIKHKDNKYQEGEFDIKIFCVTDGSFVWQSAAGDRTLRQNNPKQIIRMIQQVQGVMR